MNTLISNRRKSILVIYGICFYLCTLMCPNIEASMQPVTEVQRMLLRARGYPTETVEQIIEATKSESYFVRYAALNILTERVGKDATAVLKQFLSDPDLTVRIQAAHLLGTLADRSGLEQMQKDFEELAAKAATPLPTDPNVDPDTRERIENQRNLSLHDALDVAKVLAELGDRRGFELAKHAAFNGKWKLHRAMAIYVLTEIAKTDKKVLQGEGIDPVSTFCAIAETEKDPYIFEKILFSAAKLDYDSAMLIIETAKGSPNQPESLRLRAQSVLEWVKDKKKAVEIEQRKDSGGCCE